MKSINIIITVYAVFSVFFAIVHAADSVFVPSDEQREMLQAGHKQALVLQDRYFNLTMNGSTEYFSSGKPKDQQRFTGNFQYIRLGHMYCLLEVQTSKPGTKHADASALIRVCRLINPRASYRFVSEGGDPPVFALDEKVTVKDAKHLQQIIDRTARASWRVASAPYKAADDLISYFDGSTARKESPEQGGYIVGIKEEQINGKRVIILDMKYYFKDQESNGMCSFYPDHDWAVRDSMAEGISMDTGKIVRVFKTSNEYDFTDTFPKLTKTTIETWDAEGKQLLQSEVSTITSIDFTPPDVSAFATDRYVDKQQEENWENYTMKAKRFAPWQIAGGIIGVIFIIWGICIGIFGKKDQS